jgi:hypothetical protein
MRPDFAEMGTNLTPSIEYSRSLNPATFLAISFLRIWNADLAKRQTYFFAYSALGADGYFSDGRFYMRNGMSDSVYASSNQHFQTRDIVRMDSVDYSQVTRSLARMAGLQQVAAAHFSQADGVRSHIFGSGRSRN